MTADHEREIEIVHHLLGDGAEITDIQLIDERELKLIIGPDMLNDLLAMLDHAVPDDYAPKRGSEEYREMVERGTTVTDVSTLTSGIGTLWTSYRWPGIVDFMELLVKQICTHSTPLSEHPPGRPRLDMIIQTNQDEADLMETAVAVSNEPGAVAHGFDFANALEVGKELVRNVSAWHPIYQDALDAYSSGKEEMVRPILVTLPGLRDDRDRVVQGVLVLALANIAVSNPVAAMQHLVDYAGTPASELMPVHTGMKRRKRRK